MSEQAPEGGAPPAAGGGKKIFGMDRRTAVFVGLALAAGLIWYFVKSRQSASSTAAGSAAATDGSSGGSIIGYDANGNPIYSGGAGLPADFSGEISTLQSEFGDLASEISAQQGTTGGNPATGAPGPPGPAGPPGPTGPAGPGNKTPPPTNKPRPKPKPKPKPKRKTSTVTVARWTPGRTPWNSTLSGIAAHSHTTVAELLKLNPGIRNPNVIQPGQKITVPG